MIRYENERFATVVGTWTGNDTPSFPLGERIPVEGGSVTRGSTEAGAPSAWTTTTTWRAARGAATRVRDPLGGGSSDLCGRSPVGRDHGDQRAGACVPGGDRGGSAASPRPVTAALANVDAREQLAASRARIVEAADAARRRIERDLHDGAQQRLVSLALGLDVSESSLEPNSAATRGCSRSRGRSSMPHSRNSASSLAGSIPTSSPIEASRSRLRAWPAARRCRSSSTSTAAGRCRCRCRRRPISSSSKR